MLDVAVLRMFIDPYRRVSVWVLLLQHDGHSLALARQIA